MKRSAVVAEEMLRYMYSPKDIGEGDDPVPERACRVYIEKKPVITVSFRSMLGIISLTADKINRNDLCAVNKRLGVNRLRRWKHLTLTGYSLDQVAHLQQIADGEDAGACT